jgi:hypothetical protein
MVSSGMLRRVALTRATRHNIPEDTILLNYNPSYNYHTVVPSLFRELSVKPLTLASQMHISLQLLFLLPQVKDLRDENRSSFRNAVFSSF